MIATSAKAGDRQHKLHTDRSHIRFCHNHPRAKVFCTPRRLENARLRIWQARPPEFNWRKLEGDFETAVYQTARKLRLPTSLARWVLSCADSEGGRGAWVPNRAGSGAGGWLQFLSGTFYSNAPAAWSFARSRGVQVPRRYMEWHSTIGQALTGLWMFHHEGSGQWYGAGC